MCFRETQISLLMTEKTATIAIHTTANDEREIKLQKVQSYDNTQCSEKETIGTYTWSHPATRVSTQLDILSQCRCVDKSAQG